MIILLAKEDLENKKVFYKTFLHIFIIFSFLFLLFHCSFLFALFHCSFLFALFHCSFLIIFYTSILLFLFIFSFVCSLFFSFLCFKTRLMNLPVCVKLIKSSLFFVFVSIKFCSSNFFR